VREQRGIPRLGLGRGERGDLIVNAEERTELIARIERGEVALRDLAGLTRDEIAALEFVGRTAFESRRFEKAARIFAGLEALEPDRPEHVLRRAYAEAEAGQGELAVRLVSAYLDREAKLPADDLTRALLLRARLLMSVDREKARADLRLAHVVAEGSEGARAVLEGRTR
jgi:predicted Zn-dependent protease